jgi:phage baseplate assembly protein W
MDTERQLKRIDSKLTSLLVKAQPKITLVKVSIVQKYTGLNAYELRQARENNMITRIKTSTGFWYELETIHPSLLKIPIYAAA